MFTIRVLSMLTTEWHIQGGAVGQVEVYLGEVLLEGVDGQN